MIKLLIKMKNILQNVFWILQKINLKIKYHKQKILEFMKNFLNFFIEKILKKLNF